MDDQYKVSIVVPIYNGIKYLPMLYDRLHKQTYTNIEIVLVDDFSSDHSYTMIKDFENRDERFKAVQVQHKGGCAVKAQIQGLPYCTGDYYFYASQDDFFDYDIIEKCVEKSLELNADIVLPNMVLYYENQNSPKHGDYPLDGDYSQTLTGSEAFRLSLDWKLHAFALRKMKLFQFAEFKADYYNSEEFYFRQMLLFVNKVAFCNSNFYYRQDNPDAITKSLKYFHVDILQTDMMLFELMLKQGYAKEVVKKRLWDIFVNWCRYCKRFIFSKYPKKERQYINRSLRIVFHKIIRAWLGIIRRKDEFKANN